MALIPFSLFSQEPEWKTFFELSGGKETPGYEQTIEYCKQLDAFSPAIKYTTFGESAQGRALPLLIVNTDGVFSPSGITQTNKLIVLIQACIHAGESDGKDAGLMLLRDIAIYNKYPHILDGITLLFIPIYNVDGHERRSPYGRINQNGPEEMGWRTNAQNLNLNRDYLKADAPETRAWLSLFNAWNPDFFIDCHTTDGADYQYVLTYEMEVYGNMEKAVTAWQKDIFMPAIEKSMEEKSFPVFGYVSFRNWFDPTSGIQKSAGPPMLSHGYTALRNRPGLLIETHMLKPYEPRVMSTYEMIRSTLNILGNHRVEVKNLVRDDETYTASPEIRAEPFPIRFKTDFTDSSFTEFKGVSFTADTSELTGGLWFRYSRENENMKLKLFDKVIAEKTILLPEAYIIPPQWMDIIDIVKFHGADVKILEEETELPVQSYIFSNYKWNKSPYEGRIRMGFECDPINETRKFPKGSIIIPMNQRLAKVITYLLEPEAAGSLLYWGFFNSIFEQKEYAETYIMEKFAREMIIMDPSLLGKFEEEKADAPEKFTSQWQILNWFYMQTPYWDQSKDKYPVGRIMDREILKKLNIQ